MNKTKIVTSSVSMDKVQNSIIPATIMETNKGPIEVKPQYIDSSIITVSIVMVTDGEFDQNKTGALLATINEKLSEIEI